MKENNKSKMSRDVLICSIAAYFECAYFSLDKEADCAHSKSISAICRRSIMENRLADGLVIFLIVPNSIIA